MVERSRSQRLHLQTCSGNKYFNYCKCCRITVRNANKSVLQRYTIPKDTKVPQQSYSINSLARSVTCRCLDMVDSRKIHLILCLTRIFCSNPIFLVSLSGVFQKISLGSPGFGISSLAIGQSTWSFLLQMWKIICAFI